MNRLKMCTAVLAAWSVCAGLPPAAAQSSTQSSTGESGTVNLRGQFYLPWGEPLQESIRFQLVTDDARPPEYIFSDSKGSFIVYRVRSYATYVVVVESDGKNWGQTTARFFVSGGRSPTVQIQLEPFKKEPVPGGKSISSASLQQKIPGPARKQFENALKLIDKGEREKAHPLLLRAIEMFPDYVDARNELAVELMKADKLDEAEQHLRLALQADPEAVLPNLNLGLCLQRQNRFADAQPYLEKAVQLAPDSSDGVVLLGYNLLRSGELARGETLLIRAYEIGGSRAALAQYWLARLYTRRGDYARAAAALEIYLRDTRDAADGLQLQQTLAKLRAAVQHP